MQGANNNVPINTPGFYGNPREGVSARQPDAAEMEAFTNRKKARDLMGSYGKGGLEREKMQNELALQGSRNKGVMDVQGLRNVGESQVQGLRNTGAQNVANIQEQGATGRQNSLNTSNDLKTNLMYRQGNPGQGIEEGVDRTKARASLIEANRPPAGFQPRINVTPGDAALGTQDRVYKDGVLMSNQAGTVGSQTTQAQTVDSSPRLPPTNSGAFLDSTPEMPLQSAHGAPQVGAKAGGASMAPSVAPDPRKAQPGYFGKSGGGDAAIKEVWGNAGKGMPTVGQGFQSIVDLFKKKKREGFGPQSYPINGPMRYPISRGQ